MTTNEIVSSTCESCGQQLILLYPLFQHSTFFNIWISFTDISCIWILVNNGWIPCWNGVETRSLLLKASHVEWTAACKTRQRSLHTNKTSHGVRNNPSLHHHRHHHIPPCIMFSLERGGEKKCTGKLQRRVEIKERWNQIFKTARVCGSCYASVQTGKWGKGGRAVVEGG